MYNFSLPMSIFGHFCVRIFCVCIFCVLIFGHFSFKGNFNLLFLYPHFFYPHVFFIPLFLTRLFFTPFFSTPTFLYPHFFPPHFFYPIFLPPPFFSSLLFYPSILLKYSNCIFFATLIIPPEIRVPQKIGYSQTIC